MTQSKLNERIESYYAARRDYDAKKKISDAADKLRRLRETELVDQLLKEKTKTVGREDGTKIILVNTVSIGVKKDEYGDIRKWLLETVGDDSDFVEEVVSKSALLEHVKLKIKDDKFDPSDFPRFLHCDSRPTLRVNGWENRR